MAILYANVSSEILFIRQVHTVTYLVYALVIICVFIPVMFLISCPLWLIALTMSWWDPTLGRFVTCVDTWTDENFTDYSPRSSIVTTMTLEGHLTLEQLNTLFTTNVLEATLSKDKAKIRYPELQQYLTTFLGFRVWKKDVNFSISNHISQTTCKGFLDIAVVHQEMLNKLYHKTRSPWEIVLINSVSSTGVEHSSSVIAARFHHSMVDGKSILKLMVECLGEKPLKTAQAAQLKPNFITTLKFYVMFPFNYFRLMGYIYYKFCTSHAHPWKMHNFREDKFSRISVAFSSKLPLSDLKQVAEKNKVTSSSVIMSLVAGAIRKCGVDFQDRDVIMGYPLPKENHPEKMANHVYLGVMPLPTDQISLIKRLHKCNEIFLHAKTNQLGKHTSVTAVLTGTLVYPLAREFAVNYFLPTFLTNIAGDEEGFQVGTLPCSDFRMSVGTLKGVAGVVFCAFSYKDSFHVGVTAKESVMSQQETDKLASDIALELNLLTAI